MDVTTVIVQSSENKLIYCDCSEGYCSLSSEKKVGVVNESCLRMSPCV